MEGGFGCMGMERTEFAYISICRRRDEIVNTPDALLHKGLRI